MNEQDGHEMLVARCKALEEIALYYIMLHAIGTGTHLLTEAAARSDMEKHVERLAPGCSHQ